MESTFQKIESHLQYSRHNGYRLQVLNTLFSKLSKSLEIVKLLKSGKSEVAKNDKMKTSAY